MKLINKNNPRYKYYFILAIIKIELRCLRYKILLKLFYWSCSFNYPFEDIKYWKIFNDCWKNEYFD